MRLTRAYMAGLGTTGSLLAAAACTVVFTGAVITFQGGLPVPSIGPTYGSISVGAHSVPLDRPGARIVAARAASAAAAVAPTPAALAAGTAPALNGVAGHRLPGPVPGVPLGRRPAGADGGASAPVAAPSVPPSSGASPVPASPGDGSPALSAGDSLAGTVERTTSTLGGAARGATGTLGQTLGQVSPSVGDGVTGTGQALGGAIGDLGRAVGGALRGGGG